MRTLIALLLAAFTSSAVFAADNCEAMATEKKLAGAAKTSFLKKCEKDAGASSASATCLNKATEKKLAGAAKNSFVKKCEKDAATAPAAH